MAGAYDPFAHGKFLVGARTFAACDVTRRREFPCEVWYPATEPNAQWGRTTANLPLIIYSHPSGAHRRAATFLCTHLASHGFVVAAMDHSEVVAPELKRAEVETAERTAKRIEEVIASRVPDMRFLLDQLLGGAFDLRETRIDPSRVGLREARIDPARIGLIGHSFGGWTVLATPDVEPRVHAIVALAPGGARNPKPGILPVTLEFKWGRDVPTLYLVAEDDVFTPLAGIEELFERTPGSKQMVILRHADHCHFMDDVEQAHEAVRATPATGPAAWIAEEMRPIAELTSGEKANTFARGLTLAHLDATLRANADARRFLAGDIAAELAARGIEAIAHAG
jgi:dienelactone hydrolase